MSQSLQLGDSALWSRVYNQMHYAQPATPSGFMPIPAFNIPILFSSHILAIATDSQYARSWWWLGVRAKMLIDSPGTDFGELEAYGLRVPVNAGILARFPKLTPQYRLKIEIPWWHQEMRVTIWEYLGPDDDTTEELIRTSSESIRVDLVRIETKVDNLSNS
jgi:hypothetical protein